MSMALSKAHFSFENFLRKIFYAALLKVFELYLTKAWYRQFFARYRLFFSFVLHNKAKKRLVKYVSFKKLYAICRYISTYTSTINIAEKHVARCNARNYDY